MNIVKGFRNSGRIAALGAAVLATVELTAAPGSAYAQHPGNHGGGGFHGNGGFHGGGGFHGNPGWHGGNGWHGGGHGHGGYYGGGWGGGGVALGVLGGAV